MSSAKKTKRTKSTFNERFRTENEEIGQRMKTVREDYGMPQQQMADRLGVSRSYIQNLEHGRSKIPAFIVRQYCEILDASPAQILSTDYGSIKTESGKNIRDWLFSLPEELTKPIWDIIKVFLK